jgi:hypothetical protein
MKKYDEFINETRFLSKEELKKRDDLVDLAEKFTDAAYDKLQPFLRNLEKELKNALGNKHEVDVTITTAYHGHEETGHEIDVKKYFDGNDLIYFAVEINTHGLKWSKNIQERVNQYQNFLDVVKKNGGIRLMQDQIKMYVFYAPFDFRKAVNDDDFLKSLKGMMKFDL